MKIAAILGLFAILGIAVILITRPHRLPPDQTAPAPTPATEGPAATLSYEVVHEYPHDEDALTQGLIYHDGFLYESTGLMEQSSVRKVRLETGEVVQQRAVDTRFYGEGLTEWHGRLIQLTPVRSRGLGPGNRIWQQEDPWTAIKRSFGEAAGMTYDIVSLAPKSTFTYRYGGWGLTHDDRRLIVSNGTSNLRFLDPETFRQLGSIDVGIFGG